MFQHEGGRVAYEDAQRKMSNITDEIKVKNAGIEKIHSELEKLEQEAAEARKVEQVIAFIYFFVVWCYHHFIGTHILVQECIRERESLIPLEHAARQKVTELVSVMESEKSQGSVLKAILHAKESNEIEGIYGRLGDLGAIDGEKTYLLY